MAHRVVVTTTQASPHRGVVVWRLSVCLCRPLTLWMHLRVFLFRAGPSFLTYLSREAETAVCTLSLRQVLHAGQWVGEGTLLLQKNIISKRWPDAGTGNLLGFGEKCALLSTVPI